MILSRLFIIEGIERAGKVLPAPGTHHLHVVDNKPSHLVSRSAIPSARKMCAGLRFPTMRAKARTAAFRKCSGFAFGGQVEPMT